MTFDTARLGEKLKRYRDQFQVQLPELSLATGIEEERLRSFEAGARTPTGDEVLILADFYRCDYRFFVSNERLAPFEQTDTLFRRYGEHLSKADRWAIQEFLFLCESEHFLTMELGRISIPFTFEKRGTFFKRQGEDAAESLRRHLGYADDSLSRNIYRDLRAIGIHVFRRQLSSSTISGLFIRHPVAGNCVLVNYSEDVFRQYFTAAHEAGHAVLDLDQDSSVSFTKWDKGNLSEIRANTFASRLLLPPSLLQRLPNPADWSSDDLVAWATQLQVNSDTLVFALRDAGLISQAVSRALQGKRVPREQKLDPELPESLSQNARVHRATLLRRGLSQAYVNLCFDGFSEGLISAGRLAEMLLTDLNELPSLAGLFGINLQRDD